MTNKESQAVENKQDWHDECAKVVSAFANGSAVSYISHWMTRPVGKGKGAEYGLEG